jgi:hypothetical protein
MTKRRPQRRKPFDARAGKSRRREWSKPEPYRSNGVILAPRRALAGSKARGVPTIKLTEEVM